MNQNSIYSIILIILIIFAIVQLFKCSNKQIIVQENMMNMTCDDNDTRNDTSNSNGNGNDINFYVKNNRFAANRQFRPKLTNPIPADNDFKCGPQFDWSVKHNPGANNTYSDLLWHKMSPRMILEDNCLSCKNNTYNGPTGVTENDYANANDGALQDIAVINNNNCQMCKHKKFKDITSGLPSLANYPVF